MNDIQGIAAVAVGTLLAAINVTGIPLTQQKVVHFGAGWSGIGIGLLFLAAMVDAGLDESEARRRFYAVDRDGLLVEGIPSNREGLLVSHPLRLHNPVTEGLPTMQSELVEFRGHDPGARRRLDWLRNFGAELAKRDCVSLHPGGESLPECRVTERMS